MAAELVSANVAARIPGGLVEHVMEALQAHIRSEGLSPGDALPSENAFASELNVSRAVVREAFRSMAALHLIDIGNGRRARVSTMDKSVIAVVLDHVVQTNQITVQQILDVRRTVELRTVALAALRRSEREAAEIAGHAAGMRADFAESSRVMEHDIAFHEAIAVASKNPLFALMVGSFHVVNRQTWQVGWTARATDKVRLGNVALHEAIAQAITDRDHRAAEARMAEHFDDTVKVLLAAGIN
jgi:GntR family transcriptional repressor for pyruvate dehydrogenase complex